jgi:hypothetical protein
MNAFIDPSLKGWSNRETMIEGCQKAGYIVLQNTPFEILREEMDDALFYGNVGYIHKIVEKLEYDERWIGHVPPELYPLAGRKIDIELIGDVFKSNAHKFIKPIPSKGKSFDGFVYNAKQLDALYVANYFINGDEEVITSEVVDFRSEWRCFVCNGEILDAKHYKGDFRIFPNYEIAEQAIKLWTGAPVSWSCDLGVDKYGRTLIVECNDVMSLGTYGLAPHKAAYMLEKRWEQIHRNHSL